jgi:hypothetical protein
VRELQIHKWRTENIDGAQLLRITTQYYDTAAAKRNLLESESDIAGGSSSVGGAVKQQNTYSSHKNYDYISETEYILIRAVI